jgi:hypothetical protein
MSGEHAVGWQMIHGDDYVGADFPDACLRRMDGDQAPWESKLHLAGM